MTQSPRPARRGRARVMWLVSYDPKGTFLDCAYATLNRAQEHAEGEMWKPTITRVTVQPAPARKKAK